MGVDSTRLRSGTLTQVMQACGHSGLKVNGKPALRNRNAPRAISSGIVARSTSASRLGAAQARIQNMESREPESHTWCRDSVDYHWLEEPACFEWLGVCCQDSRRSSSKSAEKVAVICDGKEKKLLLIKPENLRVHVLSQKTFATPRHRVVSHPRLRQTDRAQHPLVGRTSRSATNLPFQHQRGDIIVPARERWWEAPVPRHGWRLDLHSCICVVSTDRRQPPRSLFWVACEPRCSPARPPCLPSDKAGYRPGPGAYLYRIYGFGLGLQRQRLPLWCWLAAIVLWTQWMHWLACFLVVGRNGSFRGTQRLLAKQHWLRC
jgi:hypothetical protein